MTDREYLLTFFDGLSAQDQDTFLVIVSLLDLPGVNPEDVYRFMLRQL